MRLYRRPHGYFYVEFKRGKARSLKTRDLSEARRLFKEIEEEGHKDRLLSLDSKVRLSVSQFLDEYLQWLQTNRAYNTYIRAERIVRKFCRIYGTRSIHSLQERDIEGYISYCRQLKNKPSTVDIEIRHLKSAFNKAIRWKYLRENPLKYIQQSGYRRQASILEKKEEIEKIFGTIKSLKYRLAFGLLIYTGARRAEVWKLCWEDIKRDHIIFRERKNKEDNEVPIVLQLQAIIDDYGQRDMGRLFDMTYDQFGKWLKHCFKLAGFKNLRVHDLRHTFASHLLMSGVDMETVRKLLGQRSMIATKTYAHILDRHKKKEIAKLPY